MRDGAADGRRLRRMEGFRIKSKQQYSQSATSEATTLKQIKFH